MSRQAGAAPPGAAYQPDDEGRGAEPEPELILVLQSSSWVRSDRPRVLEFLQRAFAQR